MATGIKKILYQYEMSRILSKISKEIKVAYRSEMARNAIKSEFRTSKMADVSHFVKNFKKIKVAYRYEIEIDFRTSKMATASHFVNGRRQPFCQKFQEKLKLCIDVKWIELRSKVIFGHPKWPPAAILSKISKKIIKVVYRFEMARN